MSEATPEQPVDENPPMARYVCDADDHHWVSRGVQGLLIRWVIECSFCGNYNVDEMNNYTLEVIER